MLLVQFSHTVTDARALLRLSSQTLLMCCCWVQVMGGSGDYFQDADTVIVMDNYTPSDQTAAAHSIAAQHAATLAAARVPQPPAGAGGVAGVWVTPRVPLRVYAGHEDGRGVKTHVRGLHHIQVRGPNKCWQEGVLGCWCRCYLIKAGALQGGAWHLCQQQ